MGARAALQLGVWAQRDERHEEAEFHYPDKISLRSYKPTLEGHPTQVKRAAKLINEAKRPLIIAGRGVVISGACAELRELAEIGQINPAYLSRVERGIVPPSDALIRSVADALKIEPESLFLLAGRVPANWQKAISNSPSPAVVAFTNITVGLGLLICDEGMVVLASVLAALPPQAEARTAAITMSKTIPSNLLYLICLTSVQ
jgi:transcriptional regulator with XRE-family HTH domain